MWIPPSDPTEEDEDVIEDPQHIQDLIKRLKSNPNYIPPERREQVMAERNREFEARIEPFRLTAEKLGLVFTKRGLDEVLSNKDNLRKYKTVLPLIIEYLPRYNEAGWHFAFGKLLATPLAGQEGAKAFVQDFLRSQYKWEAGSFLEKNPHPSVASDLIQIVDNPEYGMARQRVIVALAKTRDPRAFDVVAKLIDDPQLTGHVIEALSVIGNPRAIPLIEPHLQDKMAWIRKAAAKALKQLSPSSSIQ